MAGTVAVGCDHAGFRMKEEVKRILEQRSIQVKDFGTESEKSVDYPDYAKRVVEAILNESVRSGVLVCGTGIGMSITANRYQGIRAALVHDAATAEMARKHNNANVLVLPGRQMDLSDVEQVLVAFLSTDFEGGRHQRRLDKISAI